MDSFTIQGSGLSNSDRKQDDRLEYMIHVWNGKTTDNLLKIAALTKAFELESYIKSTEGPFLQVLFSGSIFQDRKLKTGSILQLITKQNKKYENQAQFSIVKDKVLLFRFLFPKKNIFPCGSQGVLVDQFRKPDAVYSDWERSQTGVSLSERTPKEMRNRLDSDVSGQRSERSQKKGQDKGLGQKIPSLKLGGQNGHGVGTGGFKLDFTKANTRNMDRAGPDSEDRISQSGEEVSSRDIKGSSSNRSRRQAHNDRPEIGINKLALPLPGQPPSTSGTGIGIMPSLNLANMTRPSASDINYDDIHDEDDTGDMNYDVRETVRGQVKLAHYQGQCSEIIPGFMYLGGYIVAQNRELLEEHGITHILNCAGDYCQNRFTDDLKYKTYYLKDCKPELIESVFYESIEFIEKVKEEGGRVYVHCVQGISRSSTIVLAYLILKHNLNYEGAYRMVRQKRGIISPNLGFMVQLMMFHTRVHEDYSKMTIQPKVFAVSSHQVEDPTTIVARLIFDEKFYTGKNILMLDPRGVFIVSNDSKCYIWIGDECNSSYKQLYIDYAHSYAVKLAKYENVPTNIQEIDQGSEPIEFWKMFELPGEPKPKYSYNKFWDNWYLNLNEPKLKSSRSNRSRIEYAEREELEDRPAGFIYPNFIEPQYVLDLDDLLDDSFFLLCIKDLKKVYIWKGGEFQEEEIPLTDFLNGALHSYFGENNLKDLEIVEEEPQQESENFLQYF